MTESEGDNQMTLYSPIGGDFDLKDGDELSRLATDLLGDKFTEAVEIALSLFGPEMRTDPPVIRIEANENEDTDGWDYDKFVPIPDGWTLEQVVRILSDGYTVYFEPIKE